MKQKFLLLAKPVLHERALQFADAILSIDRHDRVTSVTNLARQ
jgi:hypothetical protein